MSEAPKLPPYPKRSAGALASFTHAWNGLIHTVVHQPNMKVHVIAGMLVGLVGSGIPLGLAEKVILVFCVLLVLFAEILNSALEQLVDLAIQQFDEKVWITKDAVAVGVLVLALGIVVIFAAILVANWSTVTAHGNDIQRQVLFGVPLVCTAGFLMTRPARRSFALDLMVFLTGCGLLGALVPTSRSYVFSAMTFGLLVVAGDSARRQLKPKPHS